MKVERRNITGKVNDPRLAQYINDGWKCEDVIENSGLYTYFFIRELNETTPTNNNKTNLLT